MKKYIINEDILKSLLTDSICLSMLERDGVDNWCGYGESRKKIIEEYFPNLMNEEYKDLTFYDCAEKDLEAFREVIE